MSGPDPAILELAVVEGPHAVSQDDAKAATLALFEGAGFDLRGMAPVFDHAGVMRRTFALPLPEYRRGLSVAERNRRFLEAAGAMLREAAEGAVPAPLRSRVTHVVTVCSTGIATPSLECEVIESLGLDPGVRRVPVFGLGCAGGCAGLQIAGDLARAAPGGLVLLLCVELTSLTFLKEDRSPANFVACALFGDGAAAALVGMHGGGRAPLAVLGRGGTRLFPGTRDLMGWDVRDEGWRVVFSPRIVDVVRRHVGGLIADLAGDEKFRHFILHPGGRKILEAYRDALDLSEAELAPATAVLARCGNLSAATVLFVLDHVLGAPERVAGPAVMTAFGPGFSAEILRLELPFSGQGMGGELEGGRTAPGRGA